MSIKKALGLIMLIVPILGTWSYMIYAGAGWILLVCAGFWCWGMIVGWLLLEK